MISFEAGRDVSLIVAFSQVPDAGPASITVLDAARNTLSSGTITLTEEQVQATVVVPAVHNTISAGRLFDTRIVVVDYEVAGVTRSKRIVYRLTPTRLFTTDMSDVREFLGVRPEEVDETAVDLFSIYLELRLLLGGTVLDDALVAGDMKEIAANEAITMTAVLRILPSLRNRVAQKESDGVVSFERIRVSDYDKLQAAAEATRSAALTALTPGAVIDADAYNLVLIATPTDPVTGG